MPIRKPPSYFNGEHSTSTTIDPPASAENEFDAEMRFRMLDQKFKMLEANVRQTQQLEVIGRAAATLAHEFNNLLTPMLGYAQSAVNSSDIGFLRKALGVTVKNCSMLVAMSERVLEISAAKPVRRKMVDVRSVVDAAFESLCRDLSKDGISTQIDVPADLQVYCDPLQLQQVLFNLFLNARQAMEKSHGGILKVTGRAIWAESNGKQYPSRSAPGNESRMELEVHNTGAAIPKELLPHVFEPFQTSKTPCGDEKSRCRGLGLALCRELVEENSGSIRVASTSEKGTTFTINLPSTENAVG
jgi:signal transduction histidine kinase